MTTHVKRYAVFVSGLPQYTHGTGLQDFEKTMRIIDITQFFNSFVCCVRLCYKPYTLQVIPQQQNITSNIEVRRLCDTPETVS